MLRFLVVAALVAFALALSVSASSLQINAVRGDTRTIFSAVQVSKFLQGNSGYKYLRRAHPQEKFTALFAIKQRNLDLLQHLLYQVSDPRSPSYGDHLTLQQVGALFANPDATETVLTWLRENQITNVDVTQNGDFIYARMSVAEAEALFDKEIAEFHVFTTTNNKLALRTPAYSLPNHVSAAVDFVANIITLPMPISPRFQTVPKPNTVNAAGDVTPSTLFSYYNIQQSQSVNQGSSQSVFEALGQDYAPSDLASFQKKYGVAVNPIAEVIGPNTAFLCVLNPNTCVEATLDVEYIMAVAQNIPTVYWAIDANSQDPFLDWVVAVANSTNPPLVHSISYGGDESEEDQSNANRFDQEVQKLGLRGVTVMIASGDDGAAGADARSNPLKCGFHPSFPATVPSVTSVGATQGPEDGNPEIMCASNTGGGITSGGGFSVYFSQPSYQSSAVSGYFNSGTPSIPPTKLYNSQGRAYPDVAMLGHNYEVLLDGQISIGSGTSASAPVFAGFVALVNDARLNAGKNPLGFLNPALYQLDSGVFHDITSGRNNCAAGDGNPVCCTYGFPAAAGFDPATGRGSVDFVKLRDALLALP